MPIQICDFKHILHPHIYICKHTGRALLLYMHTLLDASKPCNISPPCMHHPITPFFSPHTSPTPASIAGRSGR